MAAYVDDASVKNSTAEDGAMATLNAKWEHVGGGEENGAASGNNSTEAPAQETLPKM